jgi:hypothetical protein
VWFQYPSYRRLGGSQGRSGQVRKISPPPGFDSRTVHPVGSAIATTLPGPPYIIYIFTYIRVFILCFVLCKKRPWCSFINFQHNPRFTTQGTTTLLVMQWQVHSIYYVLIVFYRNQKLSVNSPVEVRQARGVPETLCERIAVDFQFRNLEEKLFTVPSENRTIDPDLFNLSGCAASSVFSKEVSTHAIQKSISNDKSTSAYCLNKYSFDIFEWLWLLRWHYHQYTSLILNLKSTSLKIWYVI